MSLHFATRASLVSERASQPASQLAWRLIEPPLKQSDANGSAPRLSALHLVALNGAATDRLVVLVSIWATICTQPDNLFLSAGSASSLLAVRWIGWPSEPSECFAASLARLALLHCSEMAATMIIIIIRNAEAC